MPFDPSGNFSRVHSWQQDRDNGIRILADRHDEEDDNFGSAFNLTFLRTGTVPMTGNLMMGGNSIKLIDAGSEANPGLSFELSNQTGIWQPNPTTIAVSANGIKRFEVNSLGASVIGDLGVGNNITITGAIVTYNNMQIRDDVTNDKNHGIDFYNNDGTVVYGSVRIAPSSNELYLWGNGAGVYASDNVRFTANLNVGGTGSFGGNVWSGGSISASSTISSELAGYFTGVVVRDELANNRDVQIAFTNAQSNFTYGSIAATAAGDMQIWSNGGYVRSANNFIAPFLQSDGNASIAGTLGVGGNIYGATTMQIVGTATFNGTASIGNLTANTAWANTLTCNNFTNYGASNLNGYVTAGSGLLINGNLVVQYPGAAAGGGASSVELGSGTGEDIFTHIDFHSRYNVDFDARIQRGPGINGLFEFINGSGSGAFRLTNNAGNIEAWIGGGLQMAINSSGQVWTYGAGGFYANSGKLTMTHDGGSGYVQALTGNLYLGATGASNWGIIIDTGGATLIQRSLFVNYGPVYANGSIYAQSGDAIPLNLSDRAGNDVNHKIRWTDNAVTTTHGYMGYESGSMILNNVRNSNLQFYTNGGLCQTLEAAGCTRVGNNPWANYASGYLRVQAYGDTVAIGTDSISLGDYWPMYIQWNASAIVGGIHATGVGTQFQTTSDADLKENIEDAPDAGALFDAIKVRQFDWKGFDIHQRYGTVAQEILDVFPEAISRKEATEDSEAGPYMVDYSSMVPLLIKEIQSLRARTAHIEGHIHHPESPRRL